ncbi:MAG TPA: outer membrane beta-barrel protein [Steroidobacteraceae bacterium]|jgi:hypothetical protein
MRRSQLLHTGACSATLVFAFVAGAPQARAVDFAYQANLGLGHSDNIRRTAADEEDEDIAAAGLRFSLAEQSSRLQLDAVGDLAYDEYLHNTFDSELVGSFAGNARFALVPQRFEWVISDNFGQSLSDPFAPETPDNRENINSFSTGPDVTFAFGSQTRLRLGARYSLATYERSPFDFDTVSGEATLSRSLSSASNVSLNVRSAQTKYDEAALNADYDQDEAFVRYDVTGARTKLGVDLGYTRIDRDAAAEAEDGLLLRLNATRRVSAASTATLTVGREFSNSVSAFASMQGVGGIGLGATPGIQTAQPFTNDYVTLGWDFSRNRTKFGLYGSWSDQSYKDAGTLDQTLTSISAQVGRQLSPRTSLDLHALYDHADFKLQDTDYDDIGAGLGFTWQLSRAVSLSATYDYLKRSSDVPLNDSTENRYWLSIAYGRGTPRTAMAGPQFPVDQGSQP